MKRTFATFLVLLLSFSLAQNREETMGKFIITTPAFSDGDPIPSRHTGEGEDSSPQLDWKDVPEGTKSFALTCLDPDAPPGTWVHWILYDIPGDFAGLEERVSKDEALDSGAKQGVCWGVDSYSRVGYYGPLPPPGHGWHRYYFTLYALDVESLGLEPKATLKEVKGAMEGHVLGEATVMGKYKRD